MKTRRLDPKEVLTTPQVCDLLEITRQTLYAWMERGRVKPWMKVGGASWLFVRSEVLKSKDLKYQRG
jgi:excisionase family DNA binding protein